MQSLMGLLWYNSQIIERLFFECWLINAQRLILQVCRLIKRLKKTFEGFLILCFIPLLDSEFFIGRKAIVQSFVSFSININRIPLLQFIAVVLIFLQVSVVRWRAWLQILFFPCILYWMILIGSILANNIRKLFLIRVQYSTAFILIAISQLRFLNGIVFIKSVYFGFWMASIFYIFSIFDILPSQAVNVTQTHFSFPISTIYIWVLNQ